MTGSFSDGQCLAKHGVHVLVRCNYQFMHSEQLAHKNPNIAMSSANHSIKPSFNEALCLSVGRE